MSIVQWIEETGGIDKVVLVYKNDHDIKRLLVDLLRAEIVDHVKSLMDMLMKDTNLSMRSWKNRIRYNTKISSYYIG